MNAHVLRKWSLAKNLMFLLLPVLITLVFWCQFTTALAPSSVLSLSHNDITNHSFHHKYRRHATHLINQYANIDNHNISNDNNNNNQINSNDDHVNTKLKKTQTISNMLKALYNKNAKSTDNTNFNNLIERSKAYNQNVPSVPNLNKISQKFTHNIYADDDENDEKVDGDGDNNVIIAVRPNNSDANQTLNGDILSIEAANEQPLTDDKRMTNENASQNRIVLQFRMKRARNELYRRIVHRQQMNAFNNNSSQQQTHQIGRSRRVSRSNMNRYSNVSFKISLIMEEKTKKKSFLKSVILVNKLHVQLFFVVLLCRTIYDPISRRIGINLFDFVYLFSSISLRSFRSIHFRGVAAMI